MGNQPSSEVTEPGDRDDSSKPGSGIAGSLALGDPLPAPRGRPPQHGGDSGLHGQSPVVPSERHGVSSGGPGPDGGTGRSGAHGGASPGGANSTVGGQGLHRARPVDAQDVVLRGDSTPISPKVGVAPFNAWGNAWTSTPGSPQPSHSRGVPSAPPGAPQPWAASNQGQLALTGSVGSSSAGVPSFCPALSPPTLAMPTLRMPGEMEAEIRRKTAQILNVARQIQADQAELNQIRLAQASNAVASVPAVTPAESLMATNAMRARHLALGIRPDAEAAKVKLGHTLRAAKDLNAWFVENMSRMNTNDPTTLPSTYLEQLLERCESRMETIISGMSLGMGEANLDASMSQVVVQMGGTPLQQGAFPSHQGPQGLSQPLMSPLGMSARGQPPLQQATGLLQVQRQHAAVPQACCKMGHPLITLGTSRDDGWDCNRRHDYGGCRSGIHSFGQTRGMNRYRCDRCDYDVCERCVFVPGGQSLSPAASQPSSQAQVHGGTMVASGSTGGAGPTAQQPVEQALQPAVLTPQPPLDSAVAVAVPIAVAVPTALEVGVAVPTAVPVAISVPTGLPVAVPVAVAVPTAIAVATPTPQPDDLGLQGFWVRDPDAVER